MNLRRFQKREYKLILDLYTEGTKTEFLYIKNFIMQNNKWQDIHPIHQYAESDPELLVKSAIKYIKNTNWNKEVPHQIWVVFDHDEHEEKVNRAIHLINMYNKENPNKLIYLAFMKPCFEIWPLMHFITTKLPLHAKQVQSSLHSVLSDYNHNTQPIINVGKLPNDGYKKALEKAKSWNISLDDKQNPNSSTYFAGIYQLTEVIKNI